MTNAIDLDPIPLADLMEPPTGEAPDISDPDIWAREYFRYGILRVQGRAGEHPNHEVFAAHDREREDGAE